MEFEAQLTQLKTIKPFSCENGFMNNLHYSVKSGVGSKTLECLFDAIEVHTDSPPETNRLEQ